MRPARTARALIGAVGAVIVVVGLAVPAASRPAQVSTVPFGGTAAADGVRMVVEVPQFLVVEKFVDAGFPTAQSSIDPNGTAQSFASIPYPGDTVTALPGLIAIFTGLQEPVTYPFFISAAYPTTPKDAIDQPGYHLAVAADQAATTAKAQTGEATPSVGAGAIATTNVSQAADGTVTAVADTTLQGLTLGPLQISGFRSHAKVTRAPGGEPHRESSMDIGSVSIAGIPLAITDKGLTLASTNVLLDLFTPLASALGQAGMKLEVLAAIENPDGIVGPGLKITTSQPIPNLGRNADVSVILGQASAAATTLTLPVAAPLLPVPGPSAVAASTSGGSGGVARPATTTFAAPTAAAPSGTSAATAPASATRTRSPLQLSSWGFYPILVLAGAASVAVGRGFRLTKVRKTWSF